MPHQTPLVYFVLWETDKNNFTESNNKYNDTNYWEVKNTLPEKIKKEVDKKGNQISVHYTTVNNYLKEYFGKPRKIRKVFFLTK